MSYLIDHCATKLGTKKWRKDTELFDSSSVVNFILVWRNFRFSEENQFHFYHYRGYTRCDLDFPAMTSIFTSNYRSSFINKISSSFMDLHTFSPAKRICYLTGLFIISRFSRKEIVSEVESYVRIIIGYSVNSYRIGQNYFLAIN